MLQKKTGLENFVVHKRYSMDYEKKYVRHISRCLECGDRIRYGRTDKKFCCEECKTSYHNSQARAGRSFRIKVISAINRNYDILNGLVKAGITSADLMELTAAGFSPGMVTSYRRYGKHDEFTCYDIKYVMTRTRLFSIMKIQNLSVNLQVGIKSED